MLWWKFSKFLMSFLEAQVLTPLYFLSSNITYFGQEQPIKVQMFNILEYSDLNLLNFSCQFWND